MLRCLSEEQIDALARRQEAVLPWHVRRCVKCRQRIAAARDNLALLGDVLELDRSREQIRHLATRRTDMGSIDTNRRQANSEDNRGDDAHGFG